MSIFESIERYPAEYLPTGDRAMLMAWAVVPNANADGPDDYIRAVLCLEDGSVVSASLANFKIDFRYDLANDRWVDVSRVTDSPSQRGTDDVNSDPEA